jgi:hypothetical protein
MESTFEEDYKYLLEIFYEQVISDRFTYIYKKMEIFIQKSRFQNRVIICEKVLRQAIIDYFADIARLKHFHGIKHINKIKILAYTAYWLLYRKPLQIVDEAEEHSKIFINERFVFSSLVMDYIDTRCNIGAHRVLQKKITDFTETCSYFLKYRRYTPQSLELMILAFEAGFCCDVITKSKITS